MKYFLIQTSNVLGPTFREQVQEWSVHQSEGYARWPQGWGMLTHPDVIGLSCGFVEVGKGSRRREGVWVGLGLGLGGGMIVRVGRSRGALIGL